VAEYNRQSKIEIEQVRDFIILHYHLNERDDSHFWRNVRNMEIPASLSAKIELFKASGGIFREQDDLFVESSWLQVMLGQGIVPRDYHPMANNISESALKEMLENMKKIKRSPLAKMPSHDEFLRQVSGV